MPKYLIYTSEKFPEVFDALKPLGDTDGSLPNLVVFYSDADIRSVTKTVRDASDGSNNLIVQVQDVSHEGDGHMAKIGNFLRPHR